MARNAGSRLGPHEIAAPLGDGGMGDIYRAREIVEAWGRDMAGSSPRRLLTPVDISSDSGRAAVCVDVRGQAPSLGNLAAGGTRGFAPPVLAGFALFWMDADEYNALAAGSAPGRRASRSGRRRRAALPGLRSRLSRDHYAYIF